MKKLIIYIFLCLAIFSHTISSQELILFSYKGKYGYLNEKFNVIVLPEYDRASHLQQGYVTVRKNIHDSRIIDQNGNIVLAVDANIINHVWDDIFSYAPEGNLFLVMRLKDKKILADELGSLAYSYGDDLINVQFYKGNSRHGYIDFEGNRIFPDLILRRVTNPFSEGRASVTFDNWDIGIIDTEGNTIRSGDIYTIGRKYSEGLIPVQMNDKTTGYLNRDGEFAFTLPFMADNLPQATDFVNGLALIMTSNNPYTWRIIDNEGKYISGDILIESANTFCDGLSRIYRTTQQRKVLYGYLNTKGEFFIDPILDSADDFHNGHARIVYQGRDGLINTKGEVFWSEDIVAGRVIAQSITEMSKK